MTFDLVLIFHRYVFLEVRDIKLLLVRTQLGKTVIKGKQINTRIKAKTISLRLFTFLSTGMRAAKGRNTAHNKTRKFHGITENEKFAQSTCVFEIY